AVLHRDAPTVYHETLELQSDSGRWLVARIRGVSPPVARGPVIPVAGLRLTNVAQQAGLDFRQESFRFGVTGDPTAMMGGGVCWLDYNNDGWLDLFAVNNYTDSQFALWSDHGGPPISALFRNDHGRFVNVTKSSGTGLPIRGNGCVAADLDGDGHTDLYVTGA